MFSRLYVNYSIFGRVIGKVPEKHQKQHLSYYATPDYIPNTDSLQLELLKEPCIAVDENDVVLGTTSKRDCHLLINNSKGNL